MKASLSIAIIFLCFWYIEVNDAFITLLNIYHNIINLRALLFGVCRTISPTGPLDGILGGRFITVFFASLFLILGRAWAIIVFFYFLQFYSYNITNPVKVVLVLSLFIPQLILSLFSTIGFSKNSFKVIFHHPYLILMPTGIKIIKIILSLIVN